MSPWAVHHSAAIGGEMIIQIGIGIGIFIGIEMIAVRSCWFRSSRGESASSLNSRCVLSFGLVSSTSPSKVRALSEAIKPTHSWHKTMRNSSRANSSSSSKGSVTRAEGALIYLTWSRLPPALQFLYILPSSSSSADPDLDRGLSSGLLMPGSCPVVPITMVPANCWLVIVNFEDWNVN